MRLNLSLSAMKAVAKALKRAGRRDLAAKISDTVRLAPAKKLDEPRRAQLKARREAAQAKRMAEVRIAVWDRSNGRCECGCRAWLGSSPDVGQLDHFLGGGLRKVLTTVGNCWRLSADCHRRKTRAQPSAAHWKYRFKRHIERCEAARRSFLNPQSSPVES